MYYINIFSLLNKVIEFFNGINILLPKLIKQKNEMYAIVIAYSY